jgi:Uma2 family endonuclease
MNVPLRKPMESRPRLFSRDEFWRLYEQGFFASQRVELIGGEIVEMAPQMNWHAVGVSNVEDALKLVFDPNRFWVRNQASLDLSPMSVPDPDVAVDSGSKRDWSTRRDNPTTAVLVVEVSESTLWGDRNRKGSLYAAEGIADYWILNLEDRQLEIRRDPRPDATQEFGFGYATLTTLLAGNFATPLAAPAASIVVVDLFPG